MATNLTGSSSKQSNFRSSRWYNGLLLPSPIIDRTLNGVHVPLQFRSLWEALPLLPSSISSYCLLIHSMERLAFPNRYTCDWKTLMTVLANLVKVVTPVLLHAFWKTLNLVRTSYIGDLMSKKIKQVFALLGLFFSMPILVIGSFVFTAVVWVVQYPYFEIKNFLERRKQEKNNLTESSSP